MAPSTWLVLLLQLLSCISAGLACFCERYPWGSWSVCSSTCNYGTQHRQRNFQYDDYYWKSSCGQLCKSQDSRSCNEQSCPINCLLTEFGPWSDCSPCARKKFRTRGVQRPSQFGGSACSAELTEERPCIPTKECMLPPIDCKDNFKCTNGRCINPTLTCNKQNDCGDNSDERDCVDFKIVCPAEKRVAPGADLVGNGFDALAEEPRGAVLDNMFMGESCDIRRPGSTLLYHRIPHNFETFNITLTLFQTSPSTSQKFKIGLDIFQRFGTHYYGSGTLGGHYDLLYQYNREELKSSGTTAYVFVQAATYRFVDIPVFRKTCDQLCLYLKYFFHPGSFVQASEKSFSMVKGGRAREAAALAWERQGSAPDQTAFKNWAKSVLENPAVVQSKVLPIIDLVRGIPCAVTKRRHLRKALLQYLDEFDTCKCAPCPNNGKPVLSGTECKCLCQTGTYGTNCEKRAPDFTSDKVDGYWSCWGPWSNCGSSMKKHRTRQCNNPAPLRGGEACKGDNRHEESCHISIFTKQETCDNDDDFTEGWIEELPPGVQGCVRPKSPDNSFLRKAKQYYNYGEDEEFTCYTGFDLEGFQYINCLPDGTWSQPSGRCTRNVCLPPDIPDSMTLHPNKDEYRVEESVGLNCKEPGKVPKPQGSYKCGRSLTWEPPLPADLHCTDVEPFVPDNRCRPGEKLQGTECVCIQRESCIAQWENLCILNVDLGVTVPMSLCSFHAGLCHNDPLFYVSEGPCDADDLNQLEWAKFRAKMSNKSSVQEPCDADTCFEWETCSGESCRAARDCPRLRDHTFCVKLTKSQRIRTMDLCSMAALKCASYALEILSEGECEAR
uniref:Complement component 6, duplicate 2 n=1 Tax=Sparus aurata TaxID=8175 RepID=A0A671WT38_SPAAU